MSPPSQPNRPHDAFPGDDGSLVELLLAATNDGVLDWDLTRRTASYNARWKLLLGYELEELEDSPELWRTLSHPDDLPLVDQLLAEHLERPWPFSHTWRMRHRNREWRWILCRAVTLRHPQHGTPMRLVAAFSDVTDQVRADERYRALALASPDGMLRICADGIVVDEKPGDALTALAKASAVGKRLETAFDDERWATLTLTAVRRAIATGQVVSCEPAEPTAGRYLELRVVRSGEEEAVCIFRDMTDRKHAEQRLADSLDRLRRMHHALVDASRRAGMAEMAGSVLHDIGNVLNSVNVSAELAYEQLAGTPVRGLRDTIVRLRSEPELSQGRAALALDCLTQFTDAVLAEHAVVLTEIERLRRHITHMKVVLSRQQQYAGLSVGVTEEVAVPEVVEEAVKLSGVEEGGDVELLREYGHLPTAVLDRHRMMQIIINLLRNARAAVRAATQRRIALRIRQLDDRRFAVEVTDSGCGIPASNLTSIFQYGFTTKADGHGFGLHGSANAAKAMGGHLVACSDGPGRGSSFTLYLPLRPSAAGAATERLAG